MKIVIVIVLVVAVAAGAFFLLGGSRFAVDAKNPLGTFEKYTAFASELELGTGGAPERLQLVRFFGEDFAGREDVTCTQILGRTPGFPHFVVVARDPTGKVIAVAGQFRSQLFEYSSLPTNRTGMFMSKLWMEVIGAEPSFATKFFGTGSEQEFLEGVARKGIARGRWEKNWGGGMKIAAQVTDLVVLRAD